MRTAQLLPTFIVLAGSLLAGCTPAPAPVEERSAGEAHAPAQPEAPDLLWADPLSDCGGEQVTTIHWSAAAVAQGPVTIELGEGQGAGMFASVGAAGSKQTGAWAYPGAVFVLRGSDGQLRARLVLEGPASCPES